MNAPRFRSIGIAATALVAAIAIASCSSQAEPPKQVAAAAKMSPSQHGEYLVERVGLCGDCHTPFKPDGTPDTSKHLHGAFLGFTPKGPVPGWKDFAPSLAGLPKGWTNENTVHFLVTGEKPGGVKPGPPMPHYRFTPEDAQAVADYLGSLPKPAN